MIIFVLFLLLGTGYYATQIEPKSISVTRLDVVNDFVPISFNGTKIVQFSDTHLGPHYSVDQLQQLVDRINLMKPDIVVFTGDLMDNYTQFGLDNRIKAQQVLKKIHAPLGKFAVFGNHDRGGGGSRGYKQYMVEAGFNVLVNEVHTIRSTKGENIIIAGLDDFLLGQPQVARTLRTLREQDFNLLLVHEPDIADQLQGYPIDLQLSGHSHGGQVRVPLLDPPVTTLLAQKYVEGLYSLPYTSKSLKLYVNRGIGTTRLPVRLFAKPELTVIQLLHQSR
ncbi:putative MPP superfamily phosphohydrolase [Paenibacillus shirakamiensis]|uniref:MPP superfamily phosphohydrolase n=1 Tax=Paenibacillus shirakamiensis TaxID=1265935 RepID=A0ABS4JIJ1_9BACL|nr:metallophosphoesterase [Paenibacillus shirakamiensis]MBP2001530.1 putative MPP superfamily phosphohydrolase [Paenibacillus shirakamiensis]